MPIRQYIPWVAGAAICGVGLSAGSAFAVSITPTNDGNELVDNILGEGITVNSVTYNGANNASGTFVGAESIFGFDAGIILTTGQAIDGEGPNGNGAQAETSGGLGAEDEQLNGASTDNGFAGDPELTALAEFDTSDATTLEIEFESVGGRLFFNYVFASEEYIDFENTEFNDVFGFFLDGTNIAIIPGASTPVSINTVNSVTNSDQFNQNIDPAPFDLEYDGFTNVFRAQALDLTPGSHTIKLAIADATDGILDSAVFIQAGSFSPRVTPIDVPEPASGLGMLVVAAGGWCFWRQRQGQLS
ncbi:choice-of-anchor L domain-containing protein [Geitlerinema sp. PCC 9228]|jgi:hypothetical protein|uniref:choice-of-anchor L family PEP-CTERM protein n=1 Tax=Geitlerinema sp. PCC 9228 TaxID=111611 RepID=UPI0008F9B52E|nr:choice-of-anchor L domain-containing protein [Geitlerinema sp. PCC 9228]